MENQRAYRLRLIASLLFALAWLLFPSPARAWEQGEIPSLEQFVAQVANGEADELRGLYVPGLLADIVVPQPQGQPTFVSSQQEALTQFELASHYGTVGLLAHNYLAGNDFFQLENGQLLYLVYGDGRTETYAISRMMRYQALSPNSVMSDFVDLESGERLSASQLFGKVFQREGDVVLQTCIYADGESSWGRLFIIATPYDQYAPISMPRRHTFQ
ncbi:MAG: hypothetical protein IT314_11815 [Anaerolineales bacterium]|nr:hypothetical protein [Anaerolineales bacterium]